MGADVKVLEELLPGVFLLQAPKFEDIRGAFIKTFHEDQFRALGISMAIREEYYSISHKTVVRGMHFQLPPHDHEKLVFCLEGAIQDVLLDIRRGSGYGRVASVRLSANDGRMIFMPRGIAHGFQSLSDDTLMLYKTSTVYAPESDCGIRWDSFGFVWSLPNTIVSDRDQRHPRFNDFHSPFLPVTP